MITRKTLKGVSIIELLLWLAVVAIILISVGRFFQTQKYSAQVTQTMARIAKVNKGFIEYLSSTAPANYQAKPRQQIIDDGYASAVDFTAPWSEGEANLIPSIEGVGQNRSKMNFSIIINNIPGVLCPQLSNELRQAGYNLGTQKCVGDDQKPIKALTATFTF